MRILFSVLTVFHTFSLPYFPLLHFPPVQSTPAFSTPVLSILAIYSCFLHSGNFHSCIFSAPLPLNLVRVVWSAATAAAAGATNQVSCSSEHAQNSSASQLLTKLRGPSKSEI